MRRGHRQGYLFTLALVVVGCSGVRRYYSHAELPGLEGNEPQPSLQEADAGTVAPNPGGSKSVPWPEQELQPLATLDGPAILAANAVLQQVMKRFPEKDTKSCAFSPRSLELVIGYDAGWYFVRVNRRVDKCPEFGPGVVLEFDWFELYAVSPDGRVERFPYVP